MEINEKKHKKEQQELIIRKYQQYLKLEKSLSLNTLDAYLTDLDKLMSFLTLEGIYVLDVCLGRGCPRAYRHGCSGSRRNVGIDLLDPVYRTGHVFIYIHQPKKTKHLVVDL